ncbi:acyl-CoA thioesterase [Streptomyces venezuelae]|uniref:acyl-CoA thioesterase n=1 Tax=Streptomyces venezuelae TaxID=54571 RepID=UPI00278C3273|nr:thioesterase family protein [Streptomyces venezuelae]
MPASAFTTRVAVRWGDIDRLGHVNHVSIVEYFQEARAVFLRTGGMTTHVAVRTLTLDFAHPLTDHDHGVTVTVTVTVLGTGRTSFTIEQHALDTDGRRCARATAVLVALDPETHTARPLLPQERAHLDAYLHRSEDRPSTVG